LKHEIFKFGIAFSWRRSASIFTLNTTKNFDLGFKVYFVRNFFWYFVHFSNYVQKTIKEQQIRWFFPIFILLSRMIPISFLVLFLFLFLFIFSSRSNGLITKCRKVLKRLESRRRWYFVWSFFWNFVYFLNYTAKTFKKFKILRFMIAFSNRRSAPIRRTLQYWSDFRWILQKGLDCGF